MRFADCVTLLREKRGVGEASGLRPFASDRKKEGDRRDADPLIKTAPDWRQGVTLVPIVTETARKRGQI